MVWGGGRGGAGLRPEWREGSPGCLAPWQALRLVYPLGEEIELPPAGTGSFTGSMQMTMQKISFSPGLGSTRPCSGTCRAQPGLVLEVPPNTNMRANNVCFFFPPQLHPDPLLKLQFADVGEKSLPSSRSLLWPSVGALAVHRSHFPSCPLAPALAQAGCAWCCVAAEHHCWLLALWAGPQTRETRLSYVSSPLPGRHSPVSHLLIILSSHRCGFRTAAGPAARSCQQQLPRALGGLKPTLLPAPAFCPRNRQHG